MTAELIEGLFHINIVVRDLERSLTFYTEVLGMQIVEGPHWGQGPSQFGISQGAQMWGVDPNEARVHFAFLRFGSNEDAPIIDLLEFVEPRSWGAPYPTLQHIGLARIALKVPDVKSTYSALLERGVRFLTGPVPVNIGEGFLSEIEYCCFYDPDGVILEIYGPGGGQE